MTLKTAIAILKYHQKWRKGASIGMISSKELGKAIDKIIKKLEK